MSITGGGLMVGASSGSPFTIRITGTAAHWNNAINHNWILVQSANIIAALPLGAFAFDTSSFGNSLGAGTFSVRLSTDSHSLVLLFTAIAEIPLAGQLVNQTNNAGTTASFTVTASGAALPATYQWFQGSNPTPLSNGTDPSGSGATITIVSSGNTSTLTIGVAGVQDADAGGYTVIVTDHLGSVASSSATLTVIDPPSSPNVTPSLATPPVNAGSVDVLTASASGTQPFTYQWYLGANAISGAIGSTLTINASAAVAGSYTVVISNPAGSVTSDPYVIPGPVTQVPNQILFEPFDFPDQPSQVPPWNALGVTNKYNQFTGVGVAWLATANNDITTRPIGNMADPYVVAPYGGGTRPIATDEYPVAGLAGSSAHCIYQVSDAGGQVNLPFGTGGAITSGKVYFSLVFKVWGFNVASWPAGDLMCGLGSGAASSTTHNTTIAIQESTVSPPTGQWSWPNIPYALGVFKGDLQGTGSLNPPANGGPPNGGPVNGGWDPTDPNQRLDFQVFFVVCRLNINPSGHSTCDLWVNPPASSFYADEANLPTPTVANTGGEVADVPGGVSLFWFKCTTYPVSRDFGDVRVGTTWASVTPPSAPTLSLANVALAPGVTTAVFASQNAGNPVVGDYTWQFNGVPILSDGPTGHGSTISGYNTATLTITGVTTADLGTYTVTGSNTSPAPSDNSAALTGSASATLTFLPPPLSVVYSAPDIIISWPTNWTGYTLANTVDLNPSNWMTNWPPPYTVAGTNYTKSVNAASGTEFFRLVK